MLQAATLSDKRILVNIDTWDVDSQYPSGHYVRTLGTIGDKETEVTVWAGCAACMCKALKNT